MFRIIHPNRWFFWTISGLLIVGLILIFFISEAGSYFDKISLDFSTAPGETLSDISYLGWKSFRNESMGIVVKYPASWQIEIDPQEKNSFF